MCAICNPTILSLHFHHSYRYPNLPLKDDGLGYPPEQSYFLLKKQKNNLIDKLMVLKVALPSLGTKLFIDLLQKDNVPLGCIQVGLKM